MLETLITPWPRQPLSFPYTTYNTAGSRKVHFHILLSILRCVRLATGFKVRDSLCDCTSVQKCVCVCVGRAESGRPRRPGLVGVRCRRWTHPAWAATLGKRAAVCPRSGLPSRWMDRWYRGQVHVLLLTRAMFRSLYDHQMMLAPLP